MTSSGSSGSSDDDGGGGPPIGVIAGATIGGVAVCAALAVLAFFLYRRRKKRSRSGTLRMASLNLEAPPPPPPPPASTSTAAPVVPEGPGGIPASLVYGPFLEPAPSAGSQDWALLETLVARPPFVLLNAFHRAGQSGGREADQLARAFIYLAAAKGSAGSLLAAQIRLEIASANAEKTLFRENSMASRMFHAYSRLTALAWLQSVLAGPVQKVLASNESSSNPSSQQQSAGFSTRSRTTLDLEGGAGLDTTDPDVVEDGVALAQAVFDGLCAAAASLPADLCAVLACVRQESQARFGARAAEIAMGAFFFLRFVGPALMAPHTHGISPTAPNAAASKRLLFAARLLQNLANNTLPGAKSGREDLNAFVENNRSKRDELYDQLIARASDREVVHNNIPPNVRENSLHLIDKQIYAHKAKLLQALKGEDSLEARDCKFYIEHSTAT